MENLVDIPSVNFDAVLEANESVKNNALSKDNIFNTKNYLNTKLDESKNETEKTIVIRILPNPDEKNYDPFIRIHTHKLSGLPKEVSPSGFKNYFCLSRYNDNSDKIDHEKYGDKCPFCEINRKAYAMLREEKDEVKREQLKKLSLSNIPTKSVIMRVIERGREDEGPKFWKVNVSKREDDPYSLILKLYNTIKKSGELQGQPENIFDTFKGRDLIVTISKSKNPEDKKTSISITQALNQSPISTDENKIREWIFDKKKWNDVFGIKTYEYLSIISEGGIPWFDRDSHKWVSKAEFDKERYEKNKEKQEEAQKRAEEINLEIKKSEEALGNMFVTDDDIPF